MCGLFKDLKLPKLWVYGLFNDCRVTGELVVGKPSRERTGLNIMRIGLLSNKTSLMSSHRVLGFSSEKKEQKL